MARIALLLQSRGPGGSWQARRLPYLVRMLAEAGHRLALLGPEPQGAIDHDALLNLTGELSKDEMVREVAECDLAIGADEQCHPAVARGVPLVGLFFERTHLQLVPPDHPGCVALYPELSGRQASIAPSMVARSALGLLSGDVQRTVVRPSSGRRDTRRMMWSIIVLTHDLTDEQVVSTRRCLEAIGAHTPLSYEIVVVDRGSRPETVALIKRLGNARGVFLRGEGGTAEAVAAGAGASCGDVLVFLHNDQYVQAGWEEDYIAALDAGAALVGTDAWQIGPEGVIAAPEMGRGSWLGIAGTAVPRNVLSRLGGVADAAADYAELADLCWRATETGLRVERLEAPRMRHAGGLTRPRVSARSPGGAQPAAAREPLASAPAGLRHLLPVLARWPERTPAHLGELRAGLLAARRERVVADGYAAFFPERMTGGRGEGPTPLVSVVMATWNQERYLPAALEGILRQSHEQLQVIVVDDGSTDGTAQVLEGYDDPRLEVVRLGRNQGICAAYNAGFERVRGPYCTWTSSDNVMHDHQITRLLEVVRSREGCGLAYSDFEFFGRWRGRARWGEVTFEQVHDAGRTIGASFLFRSELLRGVGGQVGSRGRRTSVCRSQ